MVKGHPDFIQSIAFLPDGTHIVAGSDDRAIRIPDVMAGEAVMKASWCIPTLTHLSGDSSAGTPISNHILFHSCRVSPSGWIEGPAKELIFWVLPEWRSFVVWPPCFSLIAESRIIVDPQHLVHGTDWTRCLASP
jgi:WD40 repeat protein